MKARLLNAHLLQKTRHKLTFLTVVSSKSSGTQTTFSFFCKTGLTGAVILARITYTSALKQEEARRTIIKDK